MRKRYRYSQLAYDHQLTRLVVLSLERQSELDLVEHDKHKDYVKSNYVTIESSLYKVEFVKDEHTASGQDLKKNETITLKRVNSMKRALVF